MRRTRTSCSVTRASRVLSLCVLARERTTAQASSGEVMTTHRHRRHTQPTIPTPLPSPPPLAFSLPAGASRSQKALYVAVSLSVPLPPCSASQQVLHMVLRAWWGVPPPQVSSGVSLGGRGSEGGEGGQGRGAVSCLPPFPRPLGLHPLHVCPHRLHNLLGLGACNVCAAPSLPRLHGKTSILLWRVTRHAVVVGPLLSCPLPSTWWCFDL